MAVFAVLAAVFHPMALSSGPPDVQATEIPSFDRGDPSKTRFGALDYRSGLALSSDDRAFGGFSGLWLDPTGTRLVAVSDRGQWLTAGVRYDGARLAGLVDVHLQPILGPGGVPLAKTRQGDTESLSIADGTAVVGIERTNELMGFSFGRGDDPWRVLPQTQGRPIAVPWKVRNVLSAAGFNAGFEAVALLGSGPQGKIVAFAEHSADAAGNMRGWIIENGQTAEFSVRQLPGDYSLTEATLLPGGDLLVLERHFSWSRGLFVRIRRLAIADIVAGAVVDGPVLLDAGYGQEIDNFEGMAVHTASDGATVVTLLSDDNFNPLQRTLLLQFTLAPEGAQPAP